RALEGAHLLGLVLGAREAEEREDEDDGREADERERDRRGQPLDEHDRALGREAAEDAGDDDARAEERQDRRALLDEPPDEPRGEEAVVEPLVHGERRRGVGDLLGHLEHLEAERAAPEEHLDDHEEDVLQGDEGAERLGGDLHGEDSTSAAPAVAPAPRGSTAVPPRFDRARQPLELWGLERARRIEALPLDAHIDVEARARVHRRHAGRADRAARDLEYRLLAVGHAEDELARSEQEPREHGRLLLALLVAVPDEEDPERDADAGAAEEEAEDREPDRTPDRPRIDERLAVPLDADRRAL